MSEGFIENLASYSRVLLTPHLQPDADAIGSVLGLAWHLHGLGKEFKIIASPGLPGYLTFLDTEKWIEPYIPSQDVNIADWADCWVLADANDINRLGPLKDAFLSSSAAKAYIDHHLYGNMALFDFSYSDTKASSTCELVIDALGVSTKMPLAMAQALYAGIVDDTGRFGFDSTTPKVMRMVAELLEAGVKPDFVTRSLYSQGTPEKMRLTGRAFDRMTMHCADRLAIMTVSLADLAYYGAVHEDLEGLVNKPLELRSVEVSALVYERRDNSIKMSMRAKSCVDVNSICRTFGGGGHRLASGAEFFRPMDAVLETVLPVIIAKIEQDAGTGGIIN